VHFTLSDPLNRPTLHTVPTFAIPRDAPISIQFPQVAGNLWQSQTYKMGNQLQILVLHEKNNFHLLSLFCSEPPFRLDNASLLRQSVHDNILWNHQAFQE